MERSPSLGLMANLASSSPLPAPDHNRSGGLGIMVIGQQQRPLVRRESAPAAPAAPASPSVAPSSSSLYLGGGSFTAAQFGRVPNFPSQYLTSLSLTPPQQNQGHRGTAAATGGSGGGASPATSSVQSDRGSLAGSGADAFLSGATIVSNAVSSSYALPPDPSAGASTGGAPVATPPAVVITKNHGGSGVGGGGGQSRKSLSPHKKDRRHSIPTSILLSPSQQRQRSVLGNVVDMAGCPLPPTHPVPEFLCHLYSMLNDPALSSMIGWIVPSRDETTDLGGGKAGIGKIVIHDPTRLQNEVLGKYYRHSKYSSFQRQLNYFGFKKRLHGSKKGKMCPCSFVHDTLGSSPQSLLSLKRRPPSGKRVGSEPNLLAGGAARGEVGGVGLKSRKGQHRRASLAKNVSIGSNVTAATAAAGSARTNATWGPSGSAAAAPASPLGVMPATDQAALFPGNPWPTPSGTPLIVGGTNPLGVLINSLGRAPVPSQRDEILRANNAVLEAKKSLARNFLKSQNEAQFGGNGSRGGEGLDFQAMVSEIGSSQPRQQQSRQRQQHQPTAQQSGVQVQQQQQKITMAMPAPNRFPNPFSAITMSDFNRMQQQEVAQQTQPPSAALMGQQQQQEPLVKPSLLPAKTVSFPSSFASTAADSGGPFAAFPAKASIIIRNGHVSSLSSGSANPPNNAASTNFLMAPTPRPGDDAVASLGDRSLYDAPGRDAAGTPEIQFNELLSNLLSTSLPPSEELFDDDMSAGEISDFGATALQVADDGMLLPE